MPRYSIMQPAITKRALAAAIIAALALGAAPAHADVRAGVDAWSRGDYAAAIAQWQGPAERGDADAQFNMGQAYKLGRGVPKDLVRAEHWFAAAANQGHARAADNYGILLFQTGRQAQALPLLSTSAERGEPRASYILGVASFNGDYAPKDWVRAYALMTRAAASGLPQAVSSLQMMNEAIPLDQRQQGSALAQELEQRAGDTRNREFAAADLGAKPGPVAIQSAAPPRPLQALELPSSAPVQRDEMGMAGADYANPVPVPRRATSAASLPKPVTRPASLPHPAPAPALAPAPTRTAGGAWRVQLGAFGVKANADAQWNRVRAALAGHPRIDLGSGAVTRLLAGGFASESDAQRACASLKAGGNACMVIKP